MQDDERVGIPEESWAVGKPVIVIVRFSSVATGCPGSGARWILGHGPLRRRRCSG